ncbi:PspC domain-containing protein [Acinetobacter sichuanensis]|uniref:PspC domain-containing protein n=1 Tax=Acinetobacter sichuanensis TaxID=2136183 RepID=A0A371YUZ0_9GAMM|nr:MULTISPECIES: PspC domain-containing protein [Acinetobacter]MDM1246019.1 PspC domain-containing protein [Acinetobacter sp. R933-2]MDM1764047.1 PspC domain-containing protein [Acinetobacter sp. 226-1]MDM1768978.1 PspC domain-containing protein [Acinetobacter sp. 226-4]MDQ9020578.1 PspC domain-containing protein [Acinetobacter sichuanensis]RFC85286.1 PspC domain-containing protein [Acinetobacter sichuanensis]
MTKSGLYRSSRQNMIAGVMGGIAERFGWNVTLLRIIFVLVSCMSAAFPGILVYLVLWLLIPKQDLQLNSPHANPYQQSIRTVHEEKYK